MTSPSCLRCFNSCHVAGFLGWSLVREGVNINVVGRMNADPDGSSFSAQFFSYYRLDERDAGDALMFVRDFNQVR